MSGRAIWFWTLLAAVLFAAIVVQQRMRPKMSVAAARVLPDLRAEAVSVIQVRPATQPEMRVERTNGGWRITQPLSYSAQSESIGGLLVALQRLEPAVLLPEKQINDRFNADEAYGFSDPQASVILTHDNTRTHLRIGRRTLPGDQVFMQVVGRPGAYVVDAALLSLVPKTVDDWRESSLVDFPLTTIDRLVVTNAARFFELQRNGTNDPWRMARPMPARAHNQRIENSLGKLRNLRVQQFVSDDPNPDLERFGLKTPEIELVIGQGPDKLAHLQFGRTVTNDNRALVFARRAGEKTVVTVPADAVLPWRASVNAFRDPHLLSSPDKVELVQVLGQAPFTLRLTANGTWTLAPHPFPADAGLVQDFLTTLKAIEVVEFSKDVVTDPDLPAFGLTPPARQYVLARSADSAIPVPKDLLTAHLQFGTPGNQPEKVYVRRTDESSVCAITTNDFARLPSAPWQFRDRKVWSFTEEDVARISITQAGKSRQIIRRGAHQWSLAPGSQGIINDLAVEETVKGVSRLTAVNWVAVGGEQRPRFGFTEHGHIILFELKNGDKAAIEFGGEAPANMAYAAVELDGQLWILEFPWLLYRDVTAYLSVPRAP